MLFTCRCSVKEAEIIKLAHWLPSFGPRLFLALSQTQFGPLLHPEALKFNLVFLSEYPNNNFCFV